MEQPSRIVLIVDDSPEDWELYRRYLLRYNAYSYTFLEVSLGQQGLELWQQHNPDVVLLDYRLPDLDGLEFLSKLQCLAQKPYLPVIMVTGQGNEAIAVQAIKAGAQDYLVKGQITPERLNLAIHGTIETVQIRSELQQRIERERLVGQITQQIYQSLDADFILQTTVTEIRQFLNTDRVLVFQLQPDGSGTVVAESVDSAWRSFLSSTIHDPCLAENHIRFGRPKSITDDPKFTDNFIKRYHQGSATVIPDIHTSDIAPCHIEFLAQFQVKANLVVPILHANQVWGLLIAHHCKAPRLWKALEIDLLKELSTQLGIALRQANLYQQSQIELAEHKRAKKVLQILEERLRLATEAADIGMWFWDLVENCLEWTTRCKTLFGFDPDAEINYERFLAALHPDDRDRTNAAVKAAIADHTEYVTEYRNVWPDGTEHWLIAKGRAFYNDRDEPVQMMGMVQDISDRKHAEINLQERTRELSQVNRLLMQTTTLVNQRNQELDQFAHIVSHDLKAPLRAISNLSVWIEDDLEDQLDGLSPDIKQNLDLLRSRVSRMEALINGLLEYARISYQETPCETFALQELLQEVLDLLNIPPSFTVEIPADLPTLTTNRLLLSQVLMNLVGNAVKHHGSDQGRVQISIQPQAEGYEFMITDNGRGIAPENHNRVFDIFQTLQSRDQKESTGVGLAIVKKIIERVGGHIQLESEVGQGTSFRFTWPMAQPTVVSQI